MKSVLVNLGKGANDGKIFSQIAEKYDFEIDLRCGRHVVNAKSVLGILSFDLSEDMVVEIYTDEDCTAFLKDIDRFIVR